MIGIQKSADVGEGLLPASILKNLDMHVRWAVPVQMRGDLDRAVDQVIVLDKSAYETDDDDGRRCNRAGCADWACRVRVSGGREEAKNKRNNTD